MTERKVMCMAAAVLLLSGCTSPERSTPELTVSDETEQITAETEEISAADNTLAEDKEALQAYADRFEELLYTDPDSSLLIEYELFLPEGYDSSQFYPLVVFIADSSCAGSDASRSLTQGRGALVWASDEWQAAHPSIVAVPSYPEVILDDHNGYTTTEYVELTKRFIEYICEEYAVDPDRVYGTGQSMGCMTTMILASEYPDLYTACMFVDGQWDVSVLQALEDQTFVYFAAEDDTNAYAGMREVMAMFDEDSTSYAYTQWDGGMSPDELSAATEELFSEEENRYFISWETGTIEAGSGKGGRGGMGSAAYHMASFDYAYRCIAVMEWLFRQ